MQVAQYTFQSPSASQVQIGKLDPSSVKEEETKQSAPQQAPTQAKNAGEVLAKDTSAATQVTPAVSQNQLLDVYA